MTGLTISRDGFTLPLEFVVEASAILAMRGSGKTYLAKVVAEEVLDAKQQLVILDPKGDLWGLKSNAAGDTAAYPIIVFGGEHADAPLEETAGELLADLVVDSELDVILDLSDFSKAGARRFAADFLERLYWRKRTRAHQTPLLVIIDEADAFVPQRIPKGGERCYGAVDTLVRRGRGRGLGTDLHVGVKTLREALAAQGVELRRRGDVIGDRGPAPRPIDPEECQRLYATGLNTTQIARQLHVKTNRVQTLLRELGVLRPPGGRPPGAAALNAVRLKLTREESAAVRLRAAQLGQPINHYLRRLVLADLATANTSDEEEVA